MATKKKDQEQPQHWTEGAWKGLPQYRCKYCPFDTLDEELMREHYLKVHLASQPTPPISVPVTDQFEETVN